MMREFMNLVELSQNWFERGTPVKITAPGWDAAEFLEDDEFDLDWRLCFVPAGEVTPNLLDPEENEISNSMGLPGKVALTKPIGPEAFKVVKP